MSKKKNNMLQLFIIKVRMLMNQHVEKMKVYIAEEVLAGSDAKEIKKLRNNPDSTWNLEKEALNKAIKKEVSGLINKIHIEAYRKGMK